MILYGVAKCQTCSTNNRIKSCTVDENGKHHSFDDHPSIVFYPDRYGRINEIAEWHCHGKYHRTDGPAVEWSDDEHEWFYNYRQILLFVHDQDIIVGKPVEIKDDIATVLKHVEGCFYEVLLGNKKVLVARV